MSKPKLILCPGCVQHIHLDDAAAVQRCPFCGEQFAASGAVGVAPKGAAISSRVKRSVMTASFVGVTMLGSAGCSETDTVQPVYGVPAPMDDVGVTDDAGKNDELNNAQPVYGVAIPYEDAGGTEDVGGGEDVSDAGAGPDEDAGDVGGSSEDAGPAPDAGDADADHDGDAG